MDRSECVKSQELMVRLNLLPTQMLSLEQFLYSKFRNTGAVFLQTSHGLANSGDGEQLEIEIPSILPVMSILIQNRQMYPVIGHGIWKKSEPTRAILKGEGDEEYKNNFGYFFI